ncbi:phage protein [Streptococcus pneumoniae]|nr:phage protein [Streptococcus pneumoniae]
MNIKALIKKYEELWNEHSPFYEPVPYTSMVELFLKELKQLDEPQKVKIPQFVAEYIEFKKKNNFHVYGAMRVIEDHYDKKVPDWFYENNIEKFCLAWLDGYEVEEEKRYFVKIKGILKEICWFMENF